MKKNDTITELTTCDLKCYYELIRDRIDKCLIKLRMTLQKDEYNKINQERLKYNLILDKVEIEINKRIENLV